MKQPVRTSGSFLFLVVGYVVTSLSKEFSYICLKVSYFKQIEKMANTIEALSVLMESQIEGVEPIVGKLNHIVSTVKKKPYDILDHRKMDFDGDFDDFYRQVVELELQLQNFIDSAVIKMPSIFQALKFISRLCCVIIQLYSFDDFIVLGLLL